MPLIDAAKKALQEKDFNKFDELWTELILTEPIDLKSLLELADSLKKYNESERALNLLELLCSHLESKQAYAQAIEVCKHIAYLTKKSDEIRALMIQLYKKAYPDSDALSEYIELAGMNNKTGSLLKALDRLNEYLKYDLGKYFYFERYGLGKVIETRPAKKEIIIDFAKKKNHFLTLDIARGLLIPVKPGDFLYLKQNTPEQLKIIATQSPIELVKLILKQFPEPLTASQIKMHLTDIIDSKRITNFWNTIKKELTRDKNIKINGRTNKTYKYIASEKERDEFVINDFKKAAPGEKYKIAEEYFKKNRELFNKIFPDLIRTANQIYQKEPATALDILLLCRHLESPPELNYDIEQILKIQKPEILLEKLNNLEHQKYLLDLIKNRNPENWYNIYKTIFFNVKNNRLLDEIIVHLQVNSALIKDIWNTVFSLPKNYPTQYQLLLRKLNNRNIQQFLNPAFIAKILDSLNYVKGVKSLITKILDLKTFDQFVARAKSEEAKRILETLSSSTGLKESQKQNYTKIIEYHFPELFKKNDDIIYTTRAALQKKQAELEHLINVEIPQNKKEISRAREFGDLSENFEYKSAKEKQAQLYERIRIIENELSKAVIITPHQVNTEVVSIGTKVALQNIEIDTHIEYTILGRWDTDLERGIISNEAPIAQKMLGKKIGDVIEIDQQHYKIIKIESC